MILRLILLLFVIVCVFDPADQILHIKTLVFIGLCAIALAEATHYQRTPPKTLAIYVTLFIAIPVISILWYFVNDGSAPYQGFSQLRSFLLIVFVFVLVCHKIDLIPMLSAVLTVLAAVVIVTFIVLHVHPELQGFLHDLGDRLALFSIYTRDYGDGNVMLRVYFITTPMMVISIAHYLDRFMSTKSWERTKYFNLLAFNILGMIIAGTRNNIFIAILLPFAIFPLYTKRPAFFYSLGICLLVLSTLPFLGRIETLLSPAEYSNNIKLGLLNDYWRIFSDPIVLVFGQGLGAYHFWAIKGESFYITEWTYLEIIRSFGLAGAIPMMALLIGPAVIAVVSPYTRQERTIGVAYIGYLVTCLSNPNLFSSSGIIVLSVVLAEVYLKGSFMKNNSPKRQVPTTAHNPLWGWHSAG